jgi:outer membrane protein assembly factor BamB
MNTSELVFVGIGRSVVALNRATGERVWATRLKGYDFVNVVVEDGSIFATCCGEIFCLDPLTGDVLWHNPLKGFGTGLATIATEHGARNRPVAVLAEEQRRAQAAATSVTT